MIPRARRASVLASTFVVLALVLTAPTAHARTLAVTTPVTAAGAAVLPPPGYYSVLLNGTPTSNAYQPLPKPSQGALAATFPTTNPPNGTNGTLTLVSMLNAGENAAVIPPGPRSVLRLGLGHVLAAVGEALKPDTTVSAYLGPAQTGATMTPLYSGATLGNGTFETTIPSTVSAGKSVLNYTGTLLDGTALSIVLGVVVRGANDTIITYPKSTLRFQSGSARLTNQLRTALNNYLETADRTQPLSAIVKARYVKGAQPLAKQRAARVQAYLEANGITGSVMVQTQQSGAKGGNIVATQLAVSQ